MNLEEFEEQEQQLERLKKIGEKLLDIADYQLNKLEVNEAPSKEVLDTLQYALAFIKVLG